MLNGFQPVTGRATDGAQTAPRPRTPEPAAGSGLYEQVIGIIVDIPLFTRTSAGPGETAKARSGQSRASGKGTY
jgi:hypothetical protein